MGVAHGGGSGLGLVRTAKSFWIKFVRHGETSDPYALISTSNNLPQNVEALEAMKLSELRALIQDMYALYLPRSCLNILWCFPHPHPLNLKGCRPTRRVYFVSRMGRALAIVNYLSIVATRYVQTRGHNITIDHD